jgi:hypothetical protein|tara:strand:+ start:1238 stop:2023 length:786 start_codon:yes stop_codon:yes gene_type:complete
MFQSREISFLVGFGGVSVLVLFFLQPIPQDPGYHQFADLRGLWGISNFGDVMSNLPFCLVGLLGFWALFQHRGDGSRIVHPSEGWMIMLAFLGITLVGPGSAYYHWSPTNDTLLWDRLPMTIAFMSIFALMILERVNVRAGQYLFPLLLVVGVLSVFYWQHTETLGRGDLRPYVWVQFFPTVAIPFMLWQLPPRYTETRQLWWMIGWYILAKLLENFDEGVFELLSGAVSGHSLKHLAAAMGTYHLVRYVQTRRQVVADNV